MKYLVLLLIVVAGIWWIRQQRSERSASASPDHPNAPQIMVSCLHCGVHIPEHDAVHGRQGVYCSQAHRQRLEA